MGRAHKRRKKEKGVDGLRVLGRVWMGGGRRGAQAVLLRVGLKRLGLWGRTGGVRVTRDESERVARARDCGARMGAGALIALGGYAEGR